MDTSRGYKGTSISVYNPQSKQWHQSWAENNGGFYKFIGEFEFTKTFYYIENNQFQLFNISSPITTILEFEIKKNQTIFKTVNSDKIF